MQPDSTLYKYSAGALFLKIDLLLASKVDVPIWSNNLSGDADTPARRGRLRGAAADFARLCERLATIDDFTFAMAALPSHGSIARGRHYRNNAALHHDLGQTGVMFFASQCRATA